MKRLALKQDEFVHIISSLLFIHHSKTNTKLLLIQYRVWQDNIILPPNSCELLILGEKTNDKRVASKPCVFRKPCKARITDPKKTLLLLQNLFNLIAALKVTR